MNKPGVLLMFLGAVLIALLLFINFPISFGVWVTLFIVSMVIAGIGTVLSIIELGKKIKADQALRGK